MRKSRFALVAAIACGSVLGTASVASAVDSTDNISSIEAGISPNFQNSTTPGPATLFTQVQTFDADEGPFKIVDKAAERVTLDFDNDLKIMDGVQDKFATCGGQGGNNLNTFTTAQAGRECEDAIVGSGQAVALVPTGAPPPAPPVIPVELTVTTINGPLTDGDLVTAGNQPGAPCVAPGENTGGPEGCDYLGDKPQLILHAYNQGLAFITTVGGEIQDSTHSSATLDYGKALVVNDAPDTAGDAGSLILFNSTVGAVESEPTTDTDEGPRELTDKKKKKKGNKTIITKEYTQVNTVTNGSNDFNYVTATCGDDGANGGLEYDFQGNWVYDDGTTDTDTFKQKCSNETVPDPTP
jgi:hypothetical protein